MDFEHRKLLVNGHWLKLYKKPLSKEALFLEIVQELTMVPFGIKGRSKNENQFLALLANYLLKTSLSSDL